MADDDAPAAGQVLEPASREDGHQSLLAQVSDGMVPVQGAVWARSDQGQKLLGRTHTLVALLEDTFVPVERNLAALGEHQRLRDTRMFFQYATEDEFAGLWRT